MSSLLVPVLDAPGVDANAAQAEPIEPSGANRTTLAAARRRRPPRTQRRLRESVASPPPSLAPVAETAGSKPSSISSSMSSFTGAPSVLFGNACCWGFGRTARGRSTDEIDDGEQADPDDVDEVPVVRHDDRGGGLSRSELAESGSDEEE